MTSRSTKRRRRWRHQNEVDTGLQEWLQNRRRRRNSTAYAMALNDEPSLQDAPVASNVGANARGTSVSASSIQPSVLLNEQPFATLNDDDLHMGDGGSTDRRRSGPGH